MIGGVVMAWYAELKRRKWYCINGIDMMRIYKQKLYDDWYNSLTDEQKFLAPYGFIRCRQNCLVSLEKIHSICDDTIILVNHLQLHMSQRYAPKVLAAFARSRVSR